ncbi:MAG: hypothetical protein GXP08_05650 [Gammaproteobacteria bacterium]|nr:hypothetical protein [Gammaproteobacteria bacterium]
MTSKVNPQRDLPFDLPNHHKSLNEQDKNELIVELARLIFLLWKSENKRNIAEEKPNER